MSLKIGIVGLPNVGKSTLFQALTKKEVLIENYPFATIDPNVGVVQVPDGRLEKLQQITKSEKVIPTVIEFVDIAGLVKNAHQGEGLGNQFLSHIREVDAIAHLLRDFADPNVAHVDDTINPERDKETIKLELIMADLQLIEKRVSALKAKVKTGAKEAQQRLGVYEKIKKNLEAEKFINEIELTNEEAEFIKELNLITQKPLIEIYNISDAVAISSSKKVHGREQKLNINVQQELELSSFSPEELKELGVKETGLDKLLIQCYQVLDLITFFTFNNKETRAWTVKSGSRAPQAAGVIHTDFEQNFIRAEVINWQELIKVGSWNAARDIGQLRTEGKDYIVQDGDVILFKI